VVGVTRGWRMGAPGGRSGAGFVGMRSGNGESQKPAVLTHRVDATTRHPHLGSWLAPCGSLLVTTENKAVAGGRELRGSRRALYGVLRVNVLIHRGLRESGIGAADTNARGIRCLSGAHPVSVRFRRMRSAVRFAAAGTEPFRSGKRVRARITARKAPFRQERGTPCGCASLRGVDGPRPRP